MDSLCYLKIIKLIISTFCFSTGIKLLYDFQQKLKKLIFYQKFPKVKEASIVTRPEVSDTKETEDWQMIDDILHSPRTLSLSQSMDDETVRSPENDGQRAVLRRIDDKDNETTDTSLPVLEHVVTPTFARTVDRSVVNEEFDSLFSNDTLEDEPGNCVSNVTLWNDI